jgi:uncharacterized protein YdhG (YjbR/CyaY superfamily)
MNKGKTNMKSVPARDVDEYLAGVPKPARATLEKLRKTIKAAAPMASEVISYQMPMYKHHGMVVGFAAFKDHCSLYPGSAVMDAHKEELKRYDTSKGTIRFSASKPPPAALIKRLVKARIKENEARFRQKEKKAVKR